MRLVGLLDDRQLLGRRPRSASLGTRQNLCLRIRTSHRHHTTPNPYGSGRSCPGHSGAVSAPELDRRVHWCKPLQTKTWYVDETYVKVRGEWMYLYRTIGDGGETLDFYLSQTRTTKAAKQFLSKALNRSPHHRPSVISTDKNRAYNEAIDSLRKEGRLPPTCQHRQVKFLNNRLESGHGKLKQRIRPVQGFKSRKTAHNAIRGFEVMRMFRKGQFRSMVDSLAGGSEARYIGRLFQVFIA
ncbi:IS6 family transposase [Aureimonas ureilytica]|uniref:IS6 family transposase n=1 Tax=Aureimonas ureilytica TaxID=401562 RepID=UPI001FCCC1E3|nr:IS6 family transposase [Aureimonas ureilytica]